jgi:hypothetical protein
MSSIRFIFGVHNHQPVGNFDHVFEHHVREVYLPFLSALVEREFFPITLHISGPLLEWLSERDTRYLDLVGRLVADGDLELLLSGFYEPILAAIPRRDRVEQVLWMREALEQRFGKCAGGLWLTERVWEPELAADLADAGVGCVLVDDRHFLVSGFERDQLHGPYRTESDGRTIVVLPIDEKLRYLVPFQPPSATATYLRSLAERGFRLAVLADDGEKFGGWPGTREWVYERGWLASFLETMTRMVQDGELVLTTPCRAAREIEPLGLAYLPTASYREMEGWSLPPAAAGRLLHLETQLGDERLRSAEGALVRGGHWRNFLVKYSEANRMHKKMQRLSLLCHERADPPEARRAIGRAQCNDAYWHGVFGGLYLPHLRAAVWRHLGHAEAVLRHGEALECQTLDMDGDGHEELWIHSAACSVVISPHRGGAVEELSVFAREVNFADVLTRRREVYHRAERPAPPPEGHAVGASDSHDLEEGLSKGELPPLDHHVRSLLDERVLGHDLPLEDYRRAAFVPIVAWGGMVMEVVDIVGGADTLSVRLALRDGDRLHAKEITVDGAGNLTVRYRWDPNAFPTGAWFAPELSVARDVEVRCHPAAEVWRYPVTTVAKSEHGLEETVQGISITPRWPVSTGEAELRVRSGDSAQ